MRWLLRRRRYLPDSDEIIFYGQPDGLDEHIVQMAISQLEPVRAWISLQPRGSVYRHLEDAVSWVLWYTGISKQQYLRDADEIGHKLSVLLILAKDRTQLDVVFRLSKEGFGNIQYRISIQRADDEFFLCYEG